jgi:hypothetical protein
MKSPIIAVNDIGADLGAGMNPSNRMVAANEERFTAVFFSEPLTSYSVGWLRQGEAAALQAKIDGIAPAVTVPRRFEYKSADNTKEFLSETDDIRAIGGDFKRVEYAGTSVSNKTLNKRLCVALDKDEIVQGSEEQAVARLTARLLRNELRRAVALISAAATNTAKTWDTTSGKDPDMDVIADMITGSTARGIPNDVVVYGETAWQKRALAHRAQSSSGGFASAMLNEAALAQLLGVSRVIVSKEMYQSAVSTKTGIVNNLVLMYCAPAGLSKDDPSNIKRFVTPTESGAVRVYRQEFAKRIEISVEHYSNIVITSTLGIRQFTVS